jgi:RNA polymerase sigma-70 factor (ECF subfamily)
MSQDVFIRVHQALNRFDPRFKFTTWIYRIASNCAIDKLRRHQPPTVSLDAPQPSGDSNVRRIQIASTDQDPSQRLESKETMKRLETAIRGLPAGYRRLIVLRHVNSLRYEQIAVVTGLPLGTVKNRIFRARAILRREIDRPETAPRRASRRWTRELPRDAGRAPAPRRAGRHPKVAFHAAKHLATCVSGAEHLLLRS